MGKKLLVLVINDIQTFYNTETRKDAGGTRQDTSHTDIRREARASSPTRFYGDHIGASGQDIGTSGQDSGTIDASGNERTIGASAVRERDREREDASGTRGEARRGEARRGGKGEGDRV